MVLIESSEDAWEPDEEWDEEEEDGDWDGEEEE